MLPLEHSAILSTFIKLPAVIKIFVLSNFEWPLKTGCIFKALTVMRDRLNISRNNLVITKIFIVGSCIWNIKRRICQQALYLGDICIQNSPNKNLNIIIPILIHFLQFCHNLSAASRIKPHIIQRNVTYLMSSNYFRQFIAGYIDFELKKVLLPPPPPPREFCRNILSWRKFQAASFKRCLHSVCSGALVSDSLLHMLL